MQTFRETFLHMFILVVCFCFVLFVIVLGWYLVWRFLLRRFSFIRELYTSDNTKNAEAPKRIREKSRRD